VSAPSSHGKPKPNRHPSVMFEIIAKDQERAKAFYSAVFGWTYETGTGGFAYVHFPTETTPLLGGIGQAHNFYLRVASLEETIDAALAAGGERLMPPSAVDGYRFAMIRDPEGNPIGLIEPFEH